MSSSRLPVLDPDAIMPLGSSGSKGGTALPLPNADGHMNRKSIFLRFCPIFKVIFCLSIPRSYKNSKINGSHYNKLDST